MTAAPPGVGSWTVLDSSVSFADPWLRVRSDHVRTADGDVFEPYHVIEALDWVTVVPLTGDGQRLLTVREYRHGIGAVLTGLPGGLVDPGDGYDRATAAAHAARRELWEETGYSGGRIERLLAVHPNPSNQTNTAYCFLATGLVRRSLPQPGGPGEAQEVAEQDLVGVLDELRAGAATMHAVHVAALWSAAARIASDVSGRFGALPARLRGVLAGGDPRCPGAAADARHPERTVGG